MIYSGSFVENKQVPGLIAKVLDVSPTRKMIKVKIEVVPKGNALWKGFTFWFPLSDWREYAWQEPG